MQDKTISIRSSIQGKIRWLLLCFDGDNASVWFTLLNSLLLSMSPKVRFLVCCSEQAHVDILWKNRPIWANGQRIKQTKLGQTLQGATCYLHHVPYTEDAINIWCRDPFFFKSGQNLDSIHLSQTGYTDKSDFLQLDLTQLDFPIIHQLQLDDTPKGTTLYLSGGNFLADEDFILVGYPEFQYTWHNTPDTHLSFQRSLLDEQQALSALLAWANDKNEHPFRKVHLLGKGFSFSKPSPLQGDKMFSHIDGYVSLTGTHKIDRNGKKKYVLLVARIERLLLPKNATKNNWTDILVEWNTYLDAVAHQLEATGDFDVWRNPVPMFGLCDLDWNTGCPYPFHPYLGLMNNVLIERTKHSKKVWLSALTPAPFLTDAIEELANIEQANINLWAAFGFEVRVIKANFHPFWKRLGGLRCLTNHF